MKKGIALLLFIIICIGGLFYSATVWKDRIQQASEIQPGQKAVSPGDKSKQTDSKQESIDYQKLVEDSMSETVSPEVKDLFMDSFAEGEKVNLLLIGSDSMKPVSEKFTENMLDAFPDRLTVDTVTSDLTSTDFADQELNDIDWDNQYDIVIYEPFTLKNNGLVVIEQEQEDLLTVQEKAMDSNAQTFFYVTPPYPIYKPNYYQTQITSLENFTKDRGILYINHWSDWPATDSEEFLSYANLDNQMTEKGITIWSDALIHTFLK